MADADLEPWCASMACRDCGDPEGRSAFTGQCQNHPDYHECEDCGAIYPLVEGTYIPGTPDRGPSWSSGGEPGDPPEFYCPACPEEPSGNLEAAE